MSDVDNKIRSVLAGHGQLATEVAKLSDTDDLYDSGMTSHASVNVMLALEDEFDLEFPDELLRKGTFESVAAIRAALQTLGVTLS
jgi:acyl carrier protein